MKLFALLCALIGFPTYAQCNLTMESFVEIELETRELTVQGMETRLTLLESNADIATMNVEDLKIYNQIQQVYNRYLCSATQHLEYGAEYEGDVAIHFIMNPEQQSQLVQIEDRFDYVSQKIRALTLDLPTPVEEVL